MKPYLSFRGVCSVLMSALFLLACGRQDDLTKLDNLQDRPDPEVRSTVTVQLREPALLTVGKWNAQTGRVVIDATDIERLETEQELFLRRVAQISEEIEPIFRYKLVLNAMSLSVPLKYRERFLEMAETASLSVETPRIIDRAPFEMDTGFRSADSLWGETSSVDFIGASKVHDQLGFKGEGIHVGIIDTGIDYTHSMFDGMGSVEAYEAVDPNLEGLGFPNAKVVGGYDFVGSAFDSGADKWQQRLPVPDSNPIDESGHGTHVAGSVAGIGDGIETYDGVAPAANLHALKVFGRNGSTNDAIVIAALEYAADPNGDLDPSDRLDVVNLSLGGGYGTPRGLYDAAIANLSRGGSVSVISAGNSGDEAYIVGSPSTSEAAISVAASVDAMDHNWKKPAAEVEYADGSMELVIAQAGGIGPTPIGFSAELVELVDAGLAMQDFSEVELAAMPGKLALVERGEVSFCEKGERVQKAGAIGFVVFQSDDSAPISMGGDCELEIPSVMIHRSVGLRLKEELAQQLSPRLSLDAGRSLEQPELIDKLTGFSSRGPRSWDALFKPEITAPGQAIISAAVGGGSRGTRMGGTSMSAPHVAGVVALIKQAFPGITNEQVKSRLMSSAQLLYDENSELYPLSRQGAGRVDVFEAINSALTFEPARWSLGQVQVDSSKTQLIEVEVSNSSDEPLDLELREEFNKEWQLIRPRELSLEAGETKKLRVAIRIEPEFDSFDIRELQGFISFFEANSEDKPLARFAMLGMLTRVANLKSEAFQVYSSSVSDSSMAFASVKLVNDSSTPATAIAFIPVAKDERKTGIISNPVRSNICDLEAVGYRMDQSADLYSEDNEIEFGFKLYQPVTKWNLCTLAAFIDVDMDGKTDYQLIDGELQDAEAEPIGEELASMEGFEFSSVATMKLKLNALRAWGQRQIKVEFAVYARSASADRQDFLTKNSETSFALNLRTEELSWLDLPNRLQVRAGDFEWMDMTRGVGSDELMILIPENASTQSISSPDAQALWLRPDYAAE